MKAMIGALILCVFFAHSTCKADMMPPCAVSNINLQPTIIKDQNPLALPNPDPVELANGFVDVKSLATYAYKPILMSFKLLSDVEQYIHPDQKGLISKLSSDTVVQKKRLQLTKISNTRRKRALMFVFLMDKQKPDPDRSAAGQGDRRNRMHVLASKRLFPEQQIVQNQYPVDVSVAKYDDGYAPQEVNFVVPTGKPREVTVSWLWSF